MSWAMTRLMAGGGCNSPEALRERPDCLPACRRPGRISQVGPQRRLAYTPAPNGLPLPPLRKHRRSRSPVRGAEHGAPGPGAGRPLQDRERARPGRHGHGVPRHADLRPAPGGGQDAQPRRWPPRPSSSSASAARPRSPAACATRTSSPSSTSAAPPDGTCYYVMELLEGESLKELVKRDGPMSLRRAVNVIEQAAPGPGPRARAGRRPPRPQAAQHHGAAARRAGLRQGAGLRPGEGAGAGGGGAAHLHRPGARHARSTCRPSRPAASPWTSAPTSTRSAGVLYYCLTGSSPYGANTVRKALTAALTQPVPPVNSKRQGAPVPPRARRLLRRRRLAREKEDRYQTAEEFIDAHAGRHGGPVTPRSWTRGPRAAPPGREGGGSGSRPSVSGARKAAGQRQQRAGLPPLPRLGRSAPSNVVVARSAAAARPPPAGPRPTVSGPRSAPLRLLPPRLLPRPARGHVHGQEGGADRRAPCSCSPRAPRCRHEAGGGDCPPPQVVEIAPHRAGPRPRRSSRLRPRRRSCSLRRPAVSRWSPVKCTSTPSGAAIFNEDGAQIGTTPWI